MATGTRKIFIILGYPFPRANAASNYIQHLACALAAAGYEITLCAVKSKGNYRYFDELKYVRDKRIKVKEFKIKTETLYQKILYRLNIGIHVPSLLSESEFSSNDVIIFYGAELSLTKALLKIRRYIHCKILACPVEHFQRNDLKWRNSLGYRQYVKFYDHFLPKMDLCLSISTAIDSYVRNRGGRSFVLPAMVDTAEYKYRSKQFEGKYRFVFSPGGGIKDSLDEMLSAIDALEYDLRSRMEFHLCGVKPQTVVNILSSRHLERTKDVIIIHPWMQYDDLALLYSQMHYLFFARPISQMTLSNFPIKVPETMCHGIVPVVSDVGDYTKIYLKDGENSIVFDDCTILACMNALKRAITLPFEKYELLSKNARKLAETRFDYHNWSADLRVQIEEMFE